VDGTATSSTLLVLEGFPVSRPRSQRILGPEQEALSPVLNLRNLQPCLPAASATEVSPFRILRTRAARRFAVQRCRASGTPSDSPFTRSIWKTRKHPPRTGHPEASLLRNYRILLKNSSDQMAADSPRKKGGPRTSISWNERVSANSLIGCFCPNRSQIFYVANRALHHLKTRKSTMNFSASDFSRMMLVACFFVIADRGSSYAQPGKLYNYSGSTYSVRKGFGYTTVHGYNFGIGSSWATRIQPNGSMHGVDRHYNSWSYNAHTGAYLNSNGYSCMGRGAARTCY
jgi:hypothetical protein